MKRAMKRAGCLSTIVSSALLLGAGVYAEKHLGVSERAAAAYERFAPEDVSAAEQLSVMPDSAAYELIMPRALSMDQEYRQAMLANLFRAR